MNLENWLALLEKRHPQTIDLGLDRCGTVYRRMGSPRPAKQVLTVGGTNGKGSTVAYIAAMSGSLGQRYGTFTSPHIFRFNERINVMGQAVSDDCIIKAFEQVELARREISLTYFEFSTLAAFLILHQAALDCAVLEVGLGGRLDTVNLIDTDCAVITPIGLDHQEYLGPDLNSIAREKAGILRPGVPVVCTQKHPPSSLLEVAERLQAPLYRREIDFDLAICPEPDVDCLQFSLGAQSIRVSRPVMAGQHQSDNLATALAAFMLLNTDCVSKADEISAAILNCRVPGRLQQVHCSPEILLDVGHNELAAEAIAAFLKSHRPSGATCVLAMLADKSAEAVAAALGRACKRWVCADTPGDRGQSGEALAGRVLSTLPGAEVKAFGPLGDAMEAAVADADEDETILVFGSFTTVSAAADWLKNSKQRESHDAARIT